MTFMPLRTSGRLLLVFRGSTARLWAMRVYSLKAATIFKLGRFLTVYGARRGLEEH